MVSSYRLSINRNFLFPLNLILIFVFTLVVTLLFFSLVVWVLCFPIFPFIVLKGWGIWGRWSEEKWRGMLVVSQPVWWGANTETNSNKDIRNKRVGHLALAVKSCNSNYHPFLFCSQQGSKLRKLGGCTSVANGDEILDANENNSSQIFFRLALRAK